MSLPSMRFSTRSVNAIRTLLIENCSQGGNRLDFGMLRYSDAAWMDDATGPAAHVRHNLEGLGTIFPPAYLLSFVVGQDAEPLHDAPDLSLYFRSRMGGALGLCFLTDELSEADVAGISQEIAIYKTVRPTLSVASAALLTQQASVTDGPAWDVLQATAPGSNALVVYAYQNDEGTDRINVKPADLQPATTYDVHSVDTGFLGTATGADILANGIDVIESPNTAAHILTITATTTRPCGRSTADPNAGDRAGDRGPRLLDDPSTSHEPLVVRELLHDAEPRRPGVANHLQRFDGFRQHHDLIRIVKFDRMVANRRIGALHDHVGRRPDAHLRSGHANLDGAGQLLVEPQHVRSRPIDPHPAPRAARQLDADALAFPRDVGRLRLHRLVVERHARAAARLSDITPRERELALPARQQHRERLGCHRLGIQAPRLVTGPRRPAVDGDQLTQHGRFGRPGAIGRRLPRDAQLKHEPADVTPIRQQIDAERLELHRFLTHDAARARVVLLDALPDSGHQTGHGGRADRLLGGGRQRGDRQDHQHVEGGHPRHGGQGNTRWRDATTT